MLSFLKTILRGDKGSVGAAPGGRRKRLSIAEGEYEAIYAIGDVHGRLDLLLDAERKVLEDKAFSGRKLVVMLGDYVDRGPESSGVLTHLASERDAGFDRICLCGNHDAVMAEFCHAPEKHGEWFRFGGRETLRSYGIDPRVLEGENRSPTLVRELLADAIPRAHLDFLAAAPISLEIGSLFFVHAGIQPGIEIRRQSDEDFLWIREPFLTDGPMLPIVVIHGHTPADQVTYGPGRIGIDTGAYSSGRLSVLRIADGATTEL